MVALKTWRFCGGPVGTGSRQKDRSAKSGFGTVAKTIRDGNQEEFNDSGSDST